MFAFSFLTCISVLLWAAFFVLAIVYTFIVYSCKDIPFDSCVLVFLMIAGLLAGGCLGTDIFGMCAMFATFWFALLCGAGSPVLAIAIAIRAARR